MYKLQFNGELLTGFEQQKVIENLAIALKRTPRDIQANLFTNLPKRIKQVETEQTAIAWQKLFAKAGAN